MKINNKFYRKKLYPIFIKKKGINKRLKENIFKFYIVKKKILTKEQYKNYISLKDIEIRIKQSFHLIYKYHVCNRNILFIGDFLNSMGSIKKVLKNTNHSFIPTNIIIEGLISNKRTIYYYAQELTRSNKSLIKNLYKNFDLVVILNTNEKEFILKEMYKFKIPIITFQEYFTKNNRSQDYKIIGDFKLQNDVTKYNFLYDMLDSLFKKGEIPRLEFIESAKQNYFKEKINNVYKEIVKEREEKQRRREHYYANQEYYKKKNKSQNKAKKAYKVKRKRS